MTSGHPGAPGLQSQRWLRERLVGMGLTEDQVVATRLRPNAAFTLADLEPAAYRPEFAPLVQRVQRLLGGGRGLALFVTSARSEPAARLDAALDLARGLGPLGRTVVLVDADFLRPGLGGLVGDTLAEGVTDMVRFGRSTRTLLQHPVPEGPWILPAGSFPADDPAPLALDAFRSVVYRVSQICDLALYVGPLPIRNELHPLTRVCDHVIYAAPEDGPESGAACADAVGRLQAQGAHVLGVVLVGAGEPELVTRAAAAPPPAPAPPVFTPPVPEPPPLVAPADPRPIEEEALRYAPPAPAAKRDGPFAPGTLYPRPSDPRPGLEPEPEPPVERLPELELDPPIAEPWRAAPATAGGTPAPWEVPPDVTLPPALESPPARSWAELEPEPEEFAPRPATSEPRKPRAPFPHIGLPELGGEQARQTPERDELSWIEPPRRSRPEPRDRTPPAGEFAFEEERRSRLPVLAVVTMLVVIAAFLVAVGPRLWQRWVGGESTPPTSSAPATPDDEEAARAQRPATTPPPPSVPPVDSSLAHAPPTRGSAARDSVASTSPGTGETASPGTAPGTGTGTGTTAPPTRPSAPPPAAAPPAGAGTTAGGAYAVHVASYKTEKHAGVEIAALARRGYSARAIEADLGSKGVWFRVLVGPYATRAEAESARAALLAIPGYDFAQVRRVPRD